MLDVKRLRVLREVADKGSFSAAAESLAYTQSAVSQQIAALERESGTTLVERNARGIRLTDAGRALVTHAEAVLAQLACAEAELEAIAGLRAGRVRMASFQTAGATLVPLAIATFRKRHPGVELSLLEAEPEDSIPLLKTGDLELALVLDPNILSESLGVGLDGIDRIHLLDDPLYVALPVEHPLAGRARVRLGELAGETWVQPTANCPCARVAELACNAAGFSPHVAFESNDYMAIQGLVAAGVGVALIPDLALTTVRDDIVIRSLGPKAPKRRVFAATLDGGYRSPAAEAMLEVLQDAASEYQRDRAPLAAAG